MSESLVRVEDLVKVYGTGHTAVRAVDGVSFDIAAGEIVLITGPSGSGKTTLLSMIGGLLKPTSGRIWLGDTELTGLGERDLPRIRAQHLGFVFQAFNLLSSLTAEQNILFPATLTGGARPEARKRAHELLDRLGLTPRAHHLPRDLSGGEMQRVAVARALVNEPRIILADEPTGNLDSKRGHEVMMILHDIARDEGRSILIVTHDPRVEDIADRILWLEDGALRDRKRESRERVRDPVCGMKVDPWTAEIEATHGGARYLFCSERCRERFVADPSAYVGGGALLDRVSPQPL